MSYVNSAGRCNSVGIATRYRLDSPRIESRWGARFSGPVQTSPGAHPVSCTMGTGSLPGVKRQRCGVDHPPHLAPRLKKDFMCFTPCVVIHLYSINQRKAHFLSLYFNFFYVFYVYRTGGSIFRKTVVYAVMIRYVLRASV